MSSINRYKRSPKGTSGSIVTGLWPGSSLHCIEALRSPRWEDYEYSVHPSPSGDGATTNSMAWLGNGWAVRQMDEKLDREALSWYVLPMFQERELGIPEVGKPEGKRQYELRPWSH